MNRLEIPFAKPASVINLRPQAGSLVQEIYEVPGTKTVRNRSMVTYEEFELVEALREGKEASFSTLIEHYHGRLLRLAQTFVSNQAVAEEVVQDTWMAVLEGIHRFEGRSSLKTWIFQILKNRAKTKGKREHRYVPFSDVASSTDQEEDGTMELERFHTSGHLTGHWAIPPTTWDENTPERLLVSKESLAQIEQAIQTLPPNQRQVIILRDIEGGDSEEVCQILNITSTNQRVLLYRARSKVRRVLNQYLQGPSSKSTARPVWSSFVPNEKLSH
jgi:RNA polymerase sigma-70 factor (ECF subfamily)